MNRTIITALCVLMVMSMFGCATKGGGYVSANTDDAGTAKFYDAEANAEAWLVFDENDERHYFNDEWIFRKDQNFDFNEFIHSERSLKIREWMERFKAYPDEMDPELLAYWEKAGLKKELHEVENENWGAWATYTPMSAYKAGNAERKYPVMFVLHGGGQPIYICEAYGLMDVAAENEVIVVTLFGGPGHKYTLEMFPDVMRELIDNYPVDESRVYCAGSSSGGMATWALGAVYTEVFAAIAPHCNSMRDASSGTAGRYVLPENSTFWREPLELPVINLFGTLEQAPNQPDDNLDGINAVLAFNGCKKIIPENIKAGLASSDISNQLAGVLFDKTYIRNAAGMRYCFGEMLNKDGIPMFRAVGQEGIGHWTSPMLPEYTWEYISQFSRDLDTGEIIYTPAE